MARRRRQEVQPDIDDAVPDWLWEFDGRQWGWHSKDVRSCQGRIEGHYRAKLKWREACREWLAERNLVTSEHCTWREFKRIEREEPHRVLRRPGGAA